MSKYLLTGGAGFIGSHLVDELIKHGHNVTVLDNLSSGKISNINKSCNFIKGDITDYNLLESLFENIDFCYHMAAIPSVQGSIDKWSDSHRVNLGSTINIFEIASKRKIPVIYASSAAVYNDPKSLFLSENSAENPISPYGLDKYCSEMQARLFFQIKGLKTLGLRFFNVYGARQDPSSSYSGVISIFIDKISKNQPIEVFGDGNQKRDFIHVSEVIDALIKSSQYIDSKGCDVFNVCTGIGTTINSLIDSLSKILNKKALVNYLPPRKADIYTSIGDPSKAKKALNFKSNMKIYEGLKHCLLR